MIVVFCTFAQGALAEPVSLQQSIERSLSYSPQVQAIQYQKNAASLDVQQAWQGYLPTVDLRLGYGVEQHSDGSTRRSGADPNDDDWDARSEAGLSLSQRLYDGEIGRQVEIQKTRLALSNHQEQGIVQRVSLQGVTVHLDVLRQRELLALARNNLQTHQEIFQLLSERERAGVGNVADVARTRARVKQAESTVSRNEADLQTALSAYLQVTGVAPNPDQFQHAGVPETMPASLQAVLQGVDQSNPDLKVANAELAEVRARYELSKTAYYPKLELLLNSRYDDQKEGDASWQNTNEAMVQLRWNLFNGGRDRTATDAAQQRKLQVRSTRDFTQLDLRRQASAAWQSYRALQEQKEAFRRATEYSRETLEAYLNQFSVSQRSLLDLLTAQSDYFQFATQYVNVSLNETLAAFQVLALTNAVNARVATASSISFVHLSKSVPMELEVPDDPVQMEPLAQVPEVEPLIQNPSEASLVTMMIGPCINKTEIETITQTLDELGLAYEQREGEGAVALVRLTEGVFAEDEARRRLASHKEKTSSAFILPTGDGDYAVYLGSFHEMDRADTLADQLKQQGVIVMLEPIQAQLSGTVFAVEQVSAQLADKAQAQILEQTNVLVRRQ